MTEILYNYPAMLIHVEQMQLYAQEMRAVGSDILNEQAALASSWQGNTGTNYQAWQTQWNDVLSQLITAYQSMTTTHESHIMHMNSQDLIEGTKWI